MMTPNPPTSQKSVKKHTLLTTKPASSCNQTLESAASDYNQKNVGLYEDVWKMIYFGLCLKLWDYSYRVMISWMILVLFRGFFYEIILLHGWNIWISIIFLLPSDTFWCKWQGCSVTHPLVSFITWYLQFRTGTGSSVIDSTISSKHDLKISSKAGTRQQWFRLFYTPFNNLSKCSHQIILYNLVQSGRL
jgi:hypothetical protein